MSSPLSTADVEKIATLAHLDLTAEEIHRFTHQLAQILQHAECLQEVDTTAVTTSWRAPTDHGSLRADEPRPSLTTEEAVRNAPVPASRGLFRVPKVIGS